MAGDWHREPEAREKLAGGEGSEATENNRNSPAARPNQSRAPKVAREVTECLTMDEIAASRAPAGARNGRVAASTMSGGSRKLRLLHHRLISAEPPARQTGADCLWKLVGKTQTLRDSARLFPVQTSHPSAASTSSKCSSGFTLGSTALIFPSLPMTKVVRSVPMYFRP
jgi:hypothetical protein